MAVEPAKIWTFFYGSYINLEVLSEIGVVPGQWEVARLPGFDIQIQPRANLVRSAGHTVYGILATASHEELSRLYEHAERALGELYLPEAVLAETLAGAWRPALCYLCPVMHPRPADPDYVDLILGPARELDFPDWYVQRVERFKP